MRHIIPAFSHLWKSACANRASCTPRRTRCKSGITRPVRRMHFTLFTTSLAFRRARLPSTSILFSQCLRISPCTVPFLPGAHASFWSTSAELAYVRSPHVLRENWLVELQRCSLLLCICKWLSQLKGLGEQNREECVSSRCNRLARQPFSLTFSYSGTKRSIAPTINMMRSVCFSTLHQFVIFGRKYNWIL